MYFCEDCGQFFEETEQQWLQDSRGDITDYIDICPYCGSVNIKEGEENGRD